MRTLKNIFVVLCLAFLASSAVAVAEPLENIADDSRCNVCGMFVAKYPNWLTQVHRADGQVSLFDGVKDMMVFYFNPEKYGAKADTLKDIWVKDYYTMNWLDGRKALYVVGSDVHGPMGHEFIPFASHEAAASFLKDHSGKAILAFDDITSEKVESMRMGMKMKMKMK
ncbi:MAG: nitrous oxide reductase accessory protein NosL [Thermodesulfobacteriota bacterium]